MPYRTAGPAPVVKAPPKRGLRRSSQTALMVLSFAVLVTLAVWPFGALPGVVLAILAFDAWASARD